MDTKNELDKINDLRKESINFSRLDVPMIVKQKQMSISMLVLELTERMLTNPIVLAQMMVNPVALAQVLREASKIGNLPLVKAEGKSIIDMTTDPLDEDDTSNKPKAFSFQPAKYVVDDNGQYVPTSPQPVDTVENSVDNKQPIDPHKILASGTVLTHKPYNKQYPQDMAGREEAEEARRKIDDVFDSAQANATTMMATEKNKKSRKVKGTPQDQNTKRGATASDAATGPISSD